MAPVTRILQHKRKHVNLAVHIRPMDLFLWMTRAQQQKWAAVAVGVVATAHAIDTGGSWNWKLEKVVAKKGRRRRRRRRR